VNLGLDGRTAIVCGASSGLGLASAEAMAADGANVVLFARRSDLLEEHAARIGGVAVEGDVRDADALDMLVTTAVERFGGIDIVVWNSGGPPPGRASDLTSEAVQGAVDLLLLPPLRLVELARPHLERSPAARIVLITSVAVTEPTDHLALSNVVRAAVTGWAKTLAREVGPDGITVNCVAPGRIATARLDELYPEGPSERDLAGIPLRRWGDPRELGDVVAFLASDRASYVTGTIVTVDGGLTRGLLT
jgi:3-oxoacyl-[acyl-carrier protein] reductase